ncbi:MAG: hypothetical protein JW827_00470 [Spirochaetes bacterium]|nr:hypothetical protein [Spirochaetota bacterium]
MKKAIFSFIFLFFIQTMLFTEGYKIIATFDLDQNNQFGGLFNRVLSQPSYANAYLDQDVFYGRDGRSLKIQAHKEDEGYCGIWMHLFRTKDLLEKKKLKFYDPIRDNKKYLSFFVKGQKGKEIFEIKVADKKRLEAEDPISAGMVNDFLKKGVTTQWQEVIIPLAEMNIDLSTFSLILFDFIETGDYTVYIDNICFKTSREQEINIKTSNYKKKKIKDVKRAMWVWLVNEILFHKDKQDELIAFCKNKNIDELFFQVLYRFTGKKGKDFSCEIINEKEHKEFIKKATSHNIKIHALDGYPDWVMRERHHEPMALCQAVVEYNKKAQPAERFYGVHLDNEPYLMIAFKSPLKRKIYQEYIEVNAKLQKIVDQDPNLVFGIDIPFFLEEPDEKSGKTELMKYRGRIKPTSFHLLDIVDNVGIMAYRDFAYGADGVIYHAADEIDYADKINKPVYIGLELFKYPLISVYFIAGLSRKEFYQALKTSAKDYAFISRLDGFRIQTFDDGHNVHIGIEIPQDFKDQEKIEQTLRKIGKRFGVNEYKRADKKIERSLENAEFGISADVEYKNFEPMEWSYNDSGEKYRGFKAILIMLPKITFAEESLSYFENELKWIRQEFSDKRSFYGFAIHYYDVYKRMK